MNRLISFGVVLAGMGSLSLSPTGCTTQELEATPARDAPAPREANEVLAARIDAPEPTAVGPQEEQDPQFAPNAFPPVLPDTERHQRAWLRDDCLRCHETGVEETPPIVHAGMPEILLAAKCRTCHVLIPGTPAPPKAPPTPEEQRFSANAFPPMIPASGSHVRTWTKDDCLLCHEDGTHDSPIIRHEGLPRILLQAKCRTCHVQVRAVEAAEPKMLR